MDKTITYNQYYDILRHSKPHILHQYRYDVETGEEKPNTLIIPPCNTDVNISNLPETYISQSRIFDKNEYYDTLKNSKPRILNQYRYDISTGVRKPTTIIIPPLNTDINMSSL